MVDIRKGITKKYGSSQSLIEFFETNVEFEGIFYIGYPLLFSAVESKTIDALLISPKYGIVVFDLVESNNLEIEKRIDVQDDCVIRLETLLKQFPELRERRELKVPVTPISYAPGVQKVNTENFACAFNHEELKDWLKKCQEWRSDSLFDKVLSVIQTVTRLKGESKRDYVKREDSRGFKLKNLEGTISVLDGDQEKAVIEYFEGVQRIRGLAGSGKTIILALKAAYLHCENPEWKIAVTFNTRALKNQFKDLIERFVAEKRGELPNWENIKIIHAWGSTSSPGIYYDICKDYGVEYFDFRASNRLKTATTSNTTPNFEVVCEKALKDIPKEKYVPKYDLILVDEAQDLSEHFLKLCHNILGAPKRLVYAYDELQKLYEGSPLRNPKEIFGVDNYSDKMLNRCYRNSRPVLTTAHALGFGIYRDKPEDERLVQFFDDPKLWKDVGYETAAGEMQAGSVVTLKRTEKTSPTYLETYLDNNIEDIIQFKSFSNKTEQAKFIAREIYNNLKKDELLYRDIIVINPEALTTRDEVGLTRAFLQKLEIGTHIAGDLNADVFFESNSIAFTGINRAKGNEVAMVYIMNADYCFEGSELKKKRNILFTAITRSKAWVRVCGIGKRMDELQKEYEKVKESQFSLTFKYPTLDEIEKMNTINRDMTEDEKQAIKSDINAVKEIIRRINSGKAMLEDYPIEMQENLKLLLKAKL
jgi:superfamily I DNA and RNA helicase